MCIRDRYETAEREFREAGRKTGREFGNSERADGDIEMCIRDRQ